MPKFVLIDPSVIDHQGHYHEHAMRVLGAASACGYRPILAANRRFRASHCERVEVHRTYRYAFWLSSTGGGLLPRLKRLARRIRRSLSPSGGPARGDRAATGADRSPSRPWLGTCIRLLRSWETRLKSRQFARDTDQLLREVLIEEGDRVFVACASAAEVAALARRIRRDAQRDGQRGGQSALADWHLLFRHQLHGADPQRPGHDVARRTLSALEKLRRTLAADRIHCHTDTADLADQYNALGVFDFRPLPVPVGNGYRAAGRRTASAEPLCVAYLGDAREEKGYQYLPRIVGDLWASHVDTGRVRFVIQSNVAVPGGSPAVASARRQLQRLPRDKVTLLDEPLSSAAYRDLVLAADLILLPYDNPDHYFAASSGILAEALVAGIPVVVPECTWMSIQLARPVGRYHRELLGRTTVLQTRLAADVPWQSDDSSWADVSRGGRVPLDGRRWRWASMAARDGATHVLVSFEAAADRGRFVELAVQQTAETADPIAETTYVLGGDDSPASVLIEMRPETRWLRAALRSVAGSAPIVLTRLRFDFLRSAAPLPRSAVGVVFSRPEELADSVREVLEHYAHYRATAQAFSAEWAAYYNIGNLMDLLLTPAQTSGPRSEQTVADPGRSTDSGRKTDRATIGRGTGYNEDEQPLPKAA